MPFKNIHEISDEKSKGSILVIGKGILIAYTISAVLIVIYGILLYSTSLSESSMPTITMIITMISIALSAIYTAIRAESRGWLNGALLGLIYMIILFLIELIFRAGVSFNGLLILRLFMGFVVGTLAGIIGINLK